MNKRSFHAWRSVIAQQICVLLLLMLAVCTVRAQIAGSGNIQGTVTDSTGAVVAHAKVTLTNVASGVDHVTQTDGAGVYSFPNIEISTYNLKVVAPGFSTYSQTNIVLEIGSNIAINPALKTGSTSQTVEVRANALALQTEDTSFKQTIDQSDVTEMPLNGREMAALITLSGGSSPAPNGDFTGSKYSYQAISVSVAGGMGNTTEWKLDGGDNNDYMANANLPFPFPDAVQEFSVESTALDPEATLHSGGLVNVVTKSGTSKYHGEAFEFIRNNALDATNFFAASKDQLHQNQFGGTFGGPMLPWTHKQLFIFAAYQRWVESSASSVNTMYVPTAANLTGDFSVTNPCNTTGVVTAGGCTASTQLYDPLTGVPLPMNKYATPPTFNAAALKLDGYLPSSASAADVAFYNANTGQVQFSIPTRFYDNQFDTRVDWAISAKNSFYARYFIDGYQAPSFFSPTNVLITFQAPGNYERVQTATAALTTVLKPDLINSFHISGTKRVDIRSSAPGINGNNVGITMYNEVPSNLQIATTNGSSTLWDSYCGTCSPGYFNVSNEGFSDELTWVKGKHQFVVGGEFTRVQFNEASAYEADGLFDFNGEFSGSGPAGGTTYGSGNLDFLWGAMNSFQQSPEQQLAMRAPLPTLYVVDTFHATKSLTIVGGIRWAPEFFPHDYFNRGTVFNMADFDADIFSQVYPNAPPGVLYYGDPGVQKSFTKNSPLQFSPNFGATWAPFGRENTIVRAGGALIYDEANFYTSNRMHFNAPFGTAASPAISGPICFSEPWLTGGTGYGCNQVGGTDTSPYPQPVHPTPANANFPAQAQYIEMPDQFHVSDTFQWTFSIQHQFKGGWQAQADYIGNHTGHMPIGTPLNPAVYTPGVWGANGTGCGRVQTTGPAAAAAKTTGGGAVGTPCSTTSNSQARFALVEANPGYGNQLGGGGYNGSYGPTGSELVNDIAWANYDGLVLTLQHRLSSTFSLLSNFTWSKCLDVADAGGDVAASSEENPYNVGMDYGRCGSDYRKIFNTTVVAKSAFKSLHGFTGYFVNDWELAPLFHITSGSPINATSGADLSLTDEGEDRPNTIPGVAVIHEAKIQGGASTVNQANREYINYMAFCSTTSSANACTNPVAPGTFGDAGRNTISGPMFFQFDAQLSRIWKLPGRFSLDTRLEAFNVLNHPNFANPGASNPSGVDTSTKFGLITAEAGGVGNPVTSFYSRLFQGAVKVTF
ncbi:MAG: carboxypeptidase-like regulatory domain-containing protein [Acidobacteriaceae bacterium]